MVKLQKRAVCGFGAVILMCLSGCAAVDSHQRVADWPALKVVEHHVSNREMRDHCAQYTGPLLSPVGCTVFYFGLDEAHIYVSKEFPSEYVLEHERLHAAGYDHTGSTAMQTLLKDWRERNKVRVVAAPPGFEAATAPLP
jgi:hypothetical protein